MRMPDATTGDGNSDTINKSAKTEICGGNPTNNNGVETDRPDGSSSIKATEIPDLSGISIRVRRRTPVYDDLFGHRID